MANKILVTGGTGYIGSHTVVELMNENFEVIIADNLSNSKLEVLDGIEKITGKRPAFEQTDLSDPKQTQSLFQNYSGIDAILHFAAFKSVGESVQNPLKYYRNNINAVLHLLEAMSEHTIPHIVFSSSCTVYGEPDELPVTEDAPVKRPNAPYGNTKKISEEIIDDHHSTDSTFSSITLRYFNPIGAHRSGHIGELPPGKPDNLVPFITQTAYGIRKELKVFGDDYNTPDGSCIRDYIDVVDLAKAHVKAVKRLLDHNNKQQFEVFNLGTGQGVSVFEIIKTFEQATGVKLNYTVTDRRPGDVEKVYADTTRANKELGWKAETSLDETLRSAWEWEKAYRKSN